MRRIIRNHNLLAGLRFSVVEFLAAAAGLIGIAVGFILVGRFPLALVATGIAVNCIAVARATLKGRDTEMTVRPWSAVFRRSHRAAVLRQHPHAQRDTWVLAALTAVPLLVVVGLVLDRPRIR